MYGKHRRTTIDASASAHPLPLHSPLAAGIWQISQLLHCLFSGCIAFLVRAFGVHMIT